MNLTGVVEGILFVVGDEGITLSDLSETLGISVDETKAILKELQNEYEKDTRGIRISFLGDAFKLTTKKEHREYYQKLIENEDSNVLSQAALETLAIVAYNQPITRLDINEIRGVDSAQMVRKLVAKGLLKEVGRSEGLGRPILYGTTSEFLDYFDLATIEDLPKIEDFTKEEETQETDLYQSKYKEEVTEEI